MSQPPLPRWIVVVLALLAIAAIAAPLAIVRTADDVPPAARRLARPARVVPKAELPAVDPTAFQAISPEDAVAYNASIPFSTDPNPAARPFRLSGTPESRARAVDCLAAAVLYEAGDDPVGQRAVAQVVLNRVRHPAFPHSVCGVVFQGSERRTGCQFTFTCDGAMMRAVLPPAWERARAMATAALGGSVDARVGHATHYHTNWVVPYWSSSLDKIVEIHTHLFFRWSGWWGTPRAFANGYAGAEPVIPQLALLSPAHRDPAAAGLPTAMLDPAMLGGETATDPTAPQDTNTFLATLDPKLAPELYPALALRACGDRPYCKFMGWTNRAATPAALPITPVQQAAMTYSYLRDRTAAFEKSLWNCAEHKRAQPGQCMKAQMSLSIAAPAAVPTPVATPEPLAGVRRKSDAAAPPVVPTLPKPAATATPAAR
ncbi:cell wall hydrolase [Sphingomonas sp. RS2018]